MKFYRVDTNSVEMSGEGFDWFTSRKEAERCKREWEARTDGSYGSENKRWAEIKLVTIQPNKKGILRALNRYASAPSNG